MQGGRPPQRTSPNSRSLDHPDPSPAPPKARRPIGGDLSHEFIILAPTGESQVYYDAAFEEIDYTSSSFSHEATEDLERFFALMTSNYAAADEKHDPVVWEKVMPDRRREGRGIEVGHIFYFGTRYSKPMGFTGVDDPYEPPAAPDHKAWPLPSPAVQAVSAQLIPASPSVARAAPSQSRRAPSAGRSGSIERRPSHTAPAAMGRLSAM